MLLMTNFPPDIRVEKEICSLSKRNDLHILCTGRKGEPELDEFEGQKITRIPAGVKRSFSQLEIIFKQTSTAWINSVSNFVEKNKIEVLHVHDLPLVGVALAVAKKYGIKVVADLHENYPSMLREKTRVPFQRIRNLGNLALKLFFSEKKWRTFEEKILPQCDAVICVIEEAKERLIRYRIKKESVYVVPNYNFISSESSIKPNESRNGNGRIDLLYAGGVDDTRDLGTLVESLKHLRVEKGQLKVTIVGADEKSKTRLNSLAKTYRVAHLLDVYTWVSREKVEQIMNETDVGLVPHRKSEHTDTTIPHKIFQYMYRRLPVIVSNCTPLDRIVTDSNCGLVYESGNSLSLCKCIESLYRNSSLRDEFAENGRTACIEKYNWGNSEKVLFALYENLNK